MARIDEPPKPFAVLVYRSGEGFLPYTHHDTEEHAEAMAKHLRHAGEHVLVRDERPQPSTGETTMTMYLIKRHGSNAANQSMTPVAILGWVEAQSQIAAIDAALARWTCYNNQHFEAKPSSRCSKAEREEANEAEAYAASEND